MSRRLTLFFSHVFYLLSLSTLQGKGKGKGKKGKGKKGTGKGKKGGSKRGTGKGKKGKGGTRTGGKTGGKGTGKGGAKAKKPRSVPTKTVIIRDANGRPKAVRQFRNPLTGKMMPLPPRGTPTVTKKVNGKSVRQYRDPNTGLFIPLPPGVGNTVKKGGSKGGAPGSRRSVPTRGRGTTKIVQYQPSSTALQGGGSAPPPPPRSGKTLSPAAGTTAWAKWARAQRNQTMNAGSRAPKRPTTGKMAKAPVVSVSVKKSSPTTAARSNPVAPTPALLTGAPPTPTVSPPTATPTSSGGGGAGLAPGAGSQGGGGEEPTPSEEDNSANSQSSTDSSKDKGLSATMIGVIVGVILAVLLMTVGVYVYLNKKDGSGAFARWNAWEDSKTGMELGRLDGRRSSAGYVDSIYGRESADFTPYIASPPGGGGKRLSYAAGSNLGSGSGGPRGSVANAAAARGSLSPSSSRGAGSQRFAAAGAQGMPPYDGSPRTASPSPTGARMSSRNIVAGKSLRPGL